MLKQPLSVLEGEKGDELEETAFQMFYTIQQHAGTYIESKFTSTEWLLHSVVTIVQACRCW